MASARSQKLEDQAATAALYVTQGRDKKSKDATRYPLDKDGKLSSASAALSLKHAKPRDLPSFPSAGLANADSASGAAASLANSHPKIIEHWTPGEIPEANKAATLAKDTQGPTIWQPELSAAGSKAALMAHREGGNVEVWRPEETDAGQSAAGQAFRKKGLSPHAGEGLTTDGKDKALVAATGAVSGSRRRAGSTPVSTPNYPDAANSASNALKAAHSVSRPSKKAPVEPSPSPRPQIDAARIHNQAITNLSREMYTSNPPVAPEIEEQKKQAGLRAAAVSMAKRMYDVQQRQIEEAAELARVESQYAASSVANRPGSSESSEETHAAPKYVNLQEAAQKLAAERLAKLHDEHAAYRQYYGTQTSPQSKKLSVRGRARRRSGSEGELDDEEKAKQVRSQMSLFSDKLAQIDHKKRQGDRDLLMAAAQRNVKANMATMDQKVFNETGKITPSMMEEWEAKAQAKAQSDSEARMVNHGRVHVGAGKFLDQSEVDAIAAAKVQPTLDEITETAERHRARDEELRQQQLERERIAAEKAADERERANKSKEEWKRFKEGEKQERRAKKEEEKAKKAEEKRKSKGGKEAAVVAGAAGAVAGTGAAAAEAGETSGEAALETGESAAQASKPETAENDEESKSSGEDDLEKFRTAETGDLSTEESAGDRAEAAATDDTAPAVEPGEKHEAPLASRIALPSAATAGATGTAAATTETTISGPERSKDKDGGRVSSWLKTKFSRRTSKQVKPDQAAAATGTSAPSTGADNPVTETTSGPATTSSEQGDDSMREVAIAGKDFAEPTTATALGAHPVTASTTGAPAAVVSPTSTDQLNADLYDNDNDSSHKAGGAGDEEKTSHRDPTNRESTSSPEISSLSSDEDPRGRSSVRLADSMGLPQNSPITKNAESLTAYQQPVNKRAGMIVGDLPPGAIAAAAGEPEPEGALDKDVEEAFKGKAVDDDGDKSKAAEQEAPLHPPPAAVPAIRDEAEGRPSTGSPARDSRFVEAL